MIEDKRVSQETVKEIYQDCQHHFWLMLGKSNLSEEIMDYATLDVIETSALLDEGYYSISDVEIACKRTILHFIGYEE